jgi:hypothetical protein
MWVAVGIIGVEVSQRRIFKKNVISDLNHGLFFFKLSTVIHYIVRANSSEFNTQR